MVRFISIEAAIDAMEEIHKNVDPSDSFESDLFHGICDTIENLLIIYQGLELSMSDFNKEAIKLANAYFEAYETVGFTYRV